MMRILNLLCFKSYYEVLQAVGISVAVLLLGAFGMVIWLQILAEPDHWAVPDATPQVRTTEPAAESS